jgi:hypothetical protein
VLYVNRFQTLRPPTTNAFDAFGEFTPSVDAFFSHRLRIVLHVGLRTLLSVAADLRRRRLLTAASFRLTLGSDDNNDSFLDAAWRDNHGLRKRVVYLHVDSGQFPTEHLSVLEKTPPSRNGDCRGGTLLSRIVPTDADEAADADDAADAVDADDAADAVDADDAAHDESINEGQPTTSIQVLESSLRHEPPTTNRSTRTSRRRLFESLSLR